MTERGLGACDLLHGVVEGKANDLDEEVDGIAREVPLGPAPVGVFDEETWMVDQFVVAPFPLAQGEATSVKEGEDRSHPCGADLITRPSWCGSAGEFRG
jgi:hypothetical protein